MVTLDSWSPFALEIIAEIVGGHNIERRFHALFAASHTRREWFDATPELLAIIEQIRAGEFDIESLPPPIWLTTHCGARAKKLNAA